MVNTPKDKINTTKKILPEIHTEGLLDIFEYDTKKIEEIDNLIEEGKTQQIKSESYKIEESISQGNTEHSLELLHTLENKFGTEHKDTYEKIYKNINDKILEKIKILSDSGEFAKAKKMMAGIENIDDTQREIIDTYEKKFKEKEDEITKQNIIQGIDALPEILLHENAENSIRHIEDIASMMKEIDDEEFLETIKDFPEKEIREVLQKTYIARNTEIFDKILDMPYSLCNNIKEMLEGVKNKKQQKKKLHDIFGITRPFFGVGEPQLDGFYDSSYYLNKNKDYLNKNKEGHDPGELFDTIRKENDNLLEQSRRYRQMSKDGKYIDMRSTIPGIGVIDKRGLNTNITMRLIGNKGITKLKRRLKGKRIISWEGDDGGRWLEVLK